MLSITVKIHIQCIICDTPARNYIRQVKGHTGYHGCDKCCDNGFYDKDGRHMTFQSIDSIKRTDNNFRSMQDEEHHLSRSILTELPINMVEDFPLDPMHLVYLGVTRRLLGKWRSTKTVPELRICSRQISEIDEVLAHLSSSLSLDFPRKCGPFHMSDSWKATECRQFLLYLGMVALPGYIRNDAYENFLVLSISIYILSHPIFCIEMLGTARYLLKKFIQQISHLYGRAELVYNIHCLCHLCDEVEKFGPLHMFSAFPFESFMRSLKRDIKGTKQPSVQLHHRTTERAIRPICRNVVTMCDDNNERIPKSANSNTIIWRNSVLSCKKPDNCVIIKGIPSIIVGFNADQVFCKSFITVENYFVKPIPSTHLGICKVRSLQSKILIRSMKDISSKCICLPSKDEFVFIPLLHTCMGNLPLN